MSPRQRTLYKQQLLLNDELGESDAGLGNGGDASEGVNISIKRHPDEHPRWDDLSLESRNQLRKIFDSGNGDLLQKFMLSIDNDESKKEVLPSSGLG